MREPNDRPLSRAAVGALVALALLAPNPVAAQEEASLSGRVVSALGEPIAGITVRLVETGRRTVTDADGRFAFDALAAGRYLVRIEDDRFGSAVERVVLAAGEAATLDLQLSPLYHVDELVVTAGPGAVTREELYQAAQALSGRELRNRAAASLGETVGSEPGVNASYFGPASSRPVIRGLGSDRVRVLEGGVGSGDLSASSPDHAVAVEPQGAERIEIVRGPATLLYGSSAIGGVVNVIDDRVPVERPATPVTGELRVLGASVNREGMLSGRLDGSAGRFAWHASGLFRSTDDYDIPGFAEAEHEEEEHEGEEHGEEEEVEGTLPNSALESSRWAGGLSFVAERGHVGVAASGYDNEYGVPGGHGGEEGGHGAEGEAHAEEGVRVDMRQRRVDGEAVLRFPSGPVRSVKARLGYADYRHFELEGPEIGTVFENEYWEGRVEAPYRLGESLDGAFGMQASRRDFSAVGEEAFVPPNETDLFAAFLFQEYEAEEVSVQAGLRWETQRSSSDADGVEVDFHGFSASGGVNWEVSGPVGVAFSVARSVKLPSADELFSDGPHLATRSFEIGKLTLEREVGTSLDATLHLHTGRFEGELTAFVNSFDDFIYQEFTGQERGGLPVLLYTQGDARFVGYEGQLHVELLHRADRHFELELFSDYTRATLLDPDEPLPRIPPLRWGTGLHYEGTPWTAILRYRRATGQDRVAPNEETTDGYSMVDATLGYRVLWGDILHELTLSGRNLLDEEARNHISLLKEFAPLPGRDIRLTYRLVF